MFFEISVAADHFSPPMRRLLASLQELRSFLSTFQEVEDKRRASFWFPTLFNGPTKSKVHVESAGSILVLDIDRAELPSSFNNLPFLWYAHQTFSRRWRLAIPLTRVMPTTEWAIHHKIWADLAGVGVERDVTRGYYVPSTPPGETREFVEHDGPIYNPDTVKTPSAVGPALLPEPSQSASVWQALKRNESLAIPPGSRATTCYATMVGAAFDKVPFEQAWAQLTPHLEGHEDPVWLVEAEHHARRGYELGLQRAQSASELQSVFVEALERGEVKHAPILPLQLSDKGRPFNNLHNLHTVLSNAPIAPIRYNTVRNVIDYDPGSLLYKKGEAAIHVVRHYCEQVHLFTPTVHDVRAALHRQALDNQYSPVEEYLKSLKWDGLPRISSFLMEHCKAEGHEGYLRSISRKFFVAAVKRAIDPGCKVDTMLVLQGGQGKGKSQLVAALGGEWASTIHLDAVSKDTIVYMHYSWLIEVDELAYRKKDVEAQKSIMSRTHDIIRMPYAATAESKARQCILIGTTNETEMLSDPTGARRFWPVTVHKIDLDEIRRLRDQLWAEAYQAAMAGECWWPGEEEAAIFAEEAVFFQEPSAIDDYMGDIRAWFMSMAPAKRPRKFAFRDLTAGAFFGRPMSPIERNQIGRALAKMGFKKKRGVLDDNEQRPMMYETPQRMFQDQIDADSPIEPVLPPVKPQSKPN